jgi:hypothetical protein
MKKVTLHVQAEIEIDERDISKIRSWSRTDLEGIVYEYKMLEFMKKIDGDIRLRISLQCPTALDLHRSVCG